MSYVPILYSYRRCPYAMRARMALKNSGIDVEIREISLKEKPSSMLKASPKGTVPVLILPNGKIIDQSLDIMLWALGNQDSTNWIQEEVQTNANDLIAINDGEFKKLLDRYKYPQRYQDLPADVLRQAIHVQIEPLNQLLSQNKFLLGDSISIADVAIFPFIRQFSMVDPRWFKSSPYESLKRWLDYFLNSELFNSVMDKYPVWKD